MIIIIRLEIFILLKPTIAELVFKYLFFHYSISEKKLDSELQNAKSYAIFRKSSLKFGRPSPNLQHKILDPLGVKLLTRLRLGLSHLDKILI